MEDKDDTNDEVNVEDEDVYCVEYYEDYGGDLHGALCVHGHDAYFFHLKWIFKFLNNVSLHKFLREIEEKTHTFYFQNFAYAKKIWKILDPSLFVLTKQN